jgi:DNA-binding GntR family transcriptional regulator
MNPAPTFDRTYPLIKSQLLSGAWRPGERIDVALLSKDFSASAIPVREVLQRLVGERLLELVPGGGFAVPDLGEKALWDLYAWHGQLVRFALRHRGPNPPEPPATAILEALDPDDEDGIVDATEAIFMAIAKGSDNDEHAIAIAAIGERLRRFRRLEPRLIKDMLPELRLVRTLTANGADGELRDAIAAYHRRRIRRVVQIVAASIHR